MSDSAAPWTVACTRLLHPWDFLGKSTGVGCHFLLQAIFLTQGSNPGLPHCRQMLYHLSHQESFPKGNQFWMFIGGTDTKAEVPILWPPDAKSWLIGKDPDAGKDWRQEEKGMTEDEMVGWHHWLNGHEFGQAPGDGEEQGSLACCSPWCRRVSLAQLSDWTITKGLEVPVKPLEYGDFRE